MRLNYEKVNLLFKPCMNSMDRNNVHEYNQAKQTKYQKLATWQKNKIVIQQKNKTQRKKITTNQLLLCGPFENQIATQDVCNKNTENVLPTLMYIQT